jgi:hypothetical protein
MEYIMEDTNKSRDFMIVKPQNWNPTFVKRQNTHRNFLGWNPASPSG